MVTTVNGRIDVARQQVKNAEGKNRG